MDGSQESEQYIREQAHFYGRDSSKLLTPYQEKVNLAAEKLAVATPTLLHTRQKLLEIARMKVDGDGYMYKKGKSRSKRLREPVSNDGESSERPKRPKSNELVRIQRISHIEETIKDINKQIGYKELRRDQASNFRQYQLCENITEEIATLKQKRYEMEVELKILKRKQQQSVWYKKKANRRDHQPNSKANKCSTKDRESTPTLSPSSCSRSSTPGLDLLELDCTPHRLSSGPNSSNQFFPPHPTKTLSSPSLPCTSTSHCSSVTYSEPIQLSSASESDGESHFR